MQVSSRGYNAYIGWQRSLRLAASIGNFPQRSHSQGRDKQTVHGHGAQTPQYIYTLPVPPDPAAARFSKINRKIICADTRPSMIVVHCKQLASSWETISGRFQYPCHTAPFLIADGWGRVSPPWFLWRLCRSNFEKPNSWAIRAGPAWVAFNMIFPFFDLFSICFVFFVYFFVVFSFLFSILFFVFESHFAKSKKCKNICFFFFFLFVFFVSFLRIIFEPKSKKTFSNYFLNRESNSQFVVELFLNGTFFRFFSNLKHLLILLSPLPVRLPQSFCDPGRICCNKLKVMCLRTVHDDRKLISYGFDKIGDDFVMFWVMMKMLTNWRSTYSWISNVWLAEILITLYIFLVLINKHTQTTLHCIVCNIWCTSIY